jgi:NAD(P)H-dependent flavin oxidoreductase YrpB (nitropropane dioxygenase family)
MKTKITELLRIKYPIIQSPMGWIATPTLVCATCNAGGLGFLATSGLTPEELRQQIREIKRNINGKLFGVNIIPTRPGFKHHINVILEEEVTVWSSGLRDPFTFLNMKKPGNIIYIPTVGSVRQAIRVEQEGADAVIVQGCEGGGHASRIASMVLIPEVVRAVRIPVIAAGGFCDGQGLAAALALGAEGIAMGTRFATTKDCSLPLQIKMKYLEARDVDADVSTIWDGLPMRVIRGKKMKRYRGWWLRFWHILPAVLATKKYYQVSWKDLTETAKIVRQMGAPLPQFLIGMEMYQRVVRTGNMERAYSPAGQVVGRIEDLPTCHELLERIVTEAEKASENMRAKFFD